MAKFRLFYMCPNPVHDKEGKFQEGEQRKIVGLLVEAATVQAARNKVENQVLHCLRCGEDFTAASETYFHAHQVKEEGLGTYRLVVKCPLCPSEKDGEKQYNLFILDVKAKNIVDAIDGTVGKTLLCPRGSHRFKAEPQHFPEALGEVRSLGLARVHSPGVTSFGARIPEAEREVETPTYLKGGEILRLDGSDWTGGRPKNLRPLGPFIKHDHVTDALPPLKKWGVQFRRPVEVQSPTGLLGLEGMDLKGFVNVKPETVDSIIIYAGDEAVARAEALKRAPGADIINVLFAGSHPLYSIYTTYLFRRGLYLMDKPEEWETQVETQLNRNMDDVEITKVYVQPEKPLVGYVQYAMYYVSRFLSHARAIAKGAHRFGRGQEQHVPEFRKEYQSIYEKHGEGPLIESVDYLVHHQPGVSLTELSLLLDLDYFRVYKAVHSMTGWGARQGPEERLRLFREAKKLFLQYGLAREIDEDFKKILKGWRPLDEPYFETCNKFIVGAFNFTGSATIWPTQPLSLKQLEEDWLKAKEIAAWLPSSAEWKIIKQQLDEEQRKKEELRKRMKLDFYTK